MIRRARDQFQCSLPVPRLKSEISPVNYFQHNTPISWPSHLSGVAHSTIALFAHYQLQRNLDTRGPSRSSTTYILSSAISNVLLTLRTSWTRSLEQRLFFLNVSSLINHTTIVILSSGSSSRYIPIPYSGLAVVNRLVEFTPAGPGCRFMRLAFDGITRHRDALLWSGLLISRIFLVFIAAAAQSCPSTGRD